MSQAVTEGGTTPSSNGWLVEYKDVSMDKPVINFNKKYFDDYDHTHQNVPNEGFIKIAKTTGAYTDLGKDGVHTGNMILHQDGKNPVEFQAKQKTNEVKK